MAREIASWAQEIFGNDDEVSFGDQLQQTADVRSGLPWDDPLWQYQKAANFNRLPAKVLDDAFKTEVCGDLPSADEAFGIPRLPEAITKALGFSAAEPAESDLSSMGDVIDRISARMAKGFQKTYAQIVERVELPVLRKRAIAEIIGNFKAVLVAQGYSQGVSNFGSEGWDHLQASAERYVTEAVAAA